MLSSDLIKERELPLKKQKMEEYLNNLNHISFNMSNIHQIYTQLDPIYLQQCLREYSPTSNRPYSAFKPVQQCIKESKIRQATALGINCCNNEPPPVLQNPERVVPIQDTERFERTYQPNVTLAPLTPKKHRYGKVTENLNNIINNHHNQTLQTVIKSEIKTEPETTTAATVRTNSSPSPTTIIQPVVKIKEEIIEDKHVKSPPQQLQQQQINENAIISVVVPPPVKYNPEIELSTDTEDSASETSEKYVSDLYKVDDLMKNIDTTIRERVVEMFRNITKEHERIIKEKDIKLADLQQQNDDLLKELNELKTNNKKLHDNSINNNNESSDENCNKVTDESCENNNSSSILKVNNECNGDTTTKSTTTTNDQIDQQPQLPQKTVIASLEDVEQQKAIINITSE